MTVTTTELWEEARRLEEPIYEEGLRPVDSADVLARFRDDWAPRHGVAAMTLAVFAEKPPAARANLLASGVLL